MELIFIIVGGAILGVAVRYVLPQRHTHGVMLVPAVATAVAAIVWVGLTWLGWPWDGGWIWAVTLVASAAGAAVVDLLVGRTRSKHDVELLNRLSRTGVPTHS